ncbi:MAG: glycosyl transferase [Chromatiaceae bacterium]|nr:glycosyl transferase [Chromatiaceae bacterium]MCP5422289.1 glycosyl transferase [Chromatiaceae bacterium]
MADAGAQAFWRIVDGVLVINLDNRVDRWEQTCEITDALVPTGKLQRVSAVLGAGLPGFGAKPWFRGRKRDRTWAGRAGVLLSHRTAIAAAQRNGWQCVLILEDDIAPTSAFEPVLPRLADALAATAWDVCYLGYTDPRTPFECLADLGDGHALYRVSGCSTTHAYLLRASTFDWLLRQLPVQADVWNWVSRHRAIDRWYYRNLSRRFRVTAVSPSIIDQRVDVSDITLRMNENTHVTRVDDGRVGGVGGFALRNLVRHLGWRLAEPRDWLRSRVKRWRGF